MAEAIENVKTLLTVAAAWAQRSQVLAAWTWQHLVNRTDVWGCYLPPHLREPGKTYGRTAPAKHRRGQVLLTEAVLQRHFRGWSPGDVAGLHSTSSNNRSRWGALDIDAHDGWTADPVVNEKAALSWYNAAVFLGFHPLLTDSNGRGGFHPLIIFTEPVPTWRIHRFLVWLTRDYRARGLTAPPEQFPKQPRIDPGRYGNWLRLFGRHHSHKREHWSRVWNGSRWLEGAEAVERILSLSGDPASLLPEVPVVPEQKPFAGRGRACSSFTSSRCHGDLASRIEAYLRRLPNRSAGEGRDDVGYAFASFLVRDLRLTDDSALAWLERWDSGNVPPKGEERLREIIKSAHAYGKRPYGTGLRHSEALNIRFTMRVE